MDRCLILGSSGVLANCLASEFLKSGIEVFGMRRSCHEIKSNFKKEITGNYKPESIAAVIEQTCPDFIVNTVAETNLETCQKDHNLAFKANIEIPMNLVAAIKTLRKKPYLVHISTDNVYSKTGYSTENETNCLNNYAFSKLMGEVALNGINALIIRTNYLAKTRRNKTYLDWVLKSIAAQEEVILFSDVQFNATSVDNIAENILIGMQNKFFGTVNLGSIGSWTKANFHLELSSFLGSDLKFSLSKCPQNLVKRPLDMRMNTVRAEDLGMKLLTQSDVLDASINGVTYDF